MNYFDEYIKNFDTSVGEINYKYHHSYRVMDNMEKIAKELNLNKEDIELAKCIGILHDIGRFKQFKEYQTFKDEQMDHANYGVEVIKQNNILEKANINKEDYEVVYAAIKNHNKYEVEKDLSERELLFTKMIRDADKLDIIYVLANPEIRKLCTVNLDGKLRKYCATILEQSNNAINLNYFVSKWISYSRVLYDWIRKTFK